MLKSLFDSAYWTEITSSNDNDENAIHKDKQAIIDN